ncbi:MAG: glycosyltransferase [Chitinivibrionales bacterium]|nr:glycosyltransferase [Chitinivibrionales bacterium]
MNIAFFTDITILGGGELWVLKMARFLKQRGHAIVIICPYRSSLYEQCLKQEISVFGYMHGRGIPFHVPLEKFLCRNSIEVVYCTVIGHFCEAALLTRLIQKINTDSGKPASIVMFKTGLPPMAGLNRWYYGFNWGPEVRGLHVVSTETKNRFLEWLGPESVPDNFIRVIREGVDTSRFSGVTQSIQQLCDQFGVDPSHLILSSSSRLYPVKGIDRLLAAFQTVARQRSNVQMIIAGSGPQQSQLEQLRDSYGLSGCVRFVGHIEAVEALLAITDIFCHPSGGDGLPNSVMEAMAMGCAVVATAVGGIPEIIHQRETGLLVPPHETQALSEAIITLIDDINLRAAVGREAKRFIHQEFNFAALSVAWEQDVSGQLDLMRSGQSVKQTPKPVKIHPCYPLLLLYTHLRTGGEETEGMILSDYLDTQRYPLSVATCYPVDEPSPARRKMEREGIEVDATCEAIADDEEKVGYLVKKIKRENIRFLIAFQNTTLAYRVMQRLEPGECCLIEHAGIAAEVHQIPKDRSCALIGVSEAIADEATRVCGRDTIVAAIPSMVDFKKYTPADRQRLRSGYGFDDAVIVLFVGRLDAKKGIDHLIKAARVVLPDNPAIRFLIVGPPDAFQTEYANRLIATAHQEFTPKRFIFAGGRQDVADIIVAADIVVLPAVGEGMSHVINEAGAAGRAVIAFNDGAAAQQLDGGNAGILISPGDTCRFTQAIADLAADQSLRDRLGQTLQQRIYRLYSATTVIQQWHDLLQKLSRNIAPIEAKPFAFVKKIVDDTSLDFPAEIQIETNTECNARCIMCPYQEVSKELPAVTMSVELYEKILRECSSHKSLRRIEPFLNNEPFTDPRIVDWIALARKMVPHAALTITTNGSLLTPPVADRLIQSGLNAIWFSFNGATRQTYEKIMGLSFDRVRGNIDYLLSIKPKELAVFTNMIDTAPMQGEIEEAIQHWRSRGVQSGSSPFVNRAGNVTNFDSLNRRKLSVLPSRICELLFYKMCIASSGDVLLCCMDWRRQVVLGNVGKQTLSEIWNGQIYRQYRHRHENWCSDRLRLCDRCSYIRC